MKPDKQYIEVLNSIKKFKDIQYDCFNALIDRVEKKHDIEFMSHIKMNKKELHAISSFFYKNIYPVLTPMNFDTTKDYPELNSKQNTIAVLLEDEHSDTQVVSFIPLDNNLPKIYQLENKSNKYITLEEIIYSQLNKIFFNKRIINYGMIKILREADIELEHNTDVYITDRMKNTLLRRRYSKPIFMVTNTTKSFTKLLSKVFDLDKSHIYRTNNAIDFSPYTMIMKNVEDARYKSFKPQFPSELIGDRDIFEAIKENDILLHHPYESYDPIIKFLETASVDPDVIGIKQTLYRVSSSDSPIVNALCEAARNGKQVSVILEIKARFDEERNISLIDKLRSSGCQLVYGVEELKTHCKFISVVRRENNKLRIYSHIATGNYNEKTAKIYTDISYFTADFKIGQDILTVFNMISGFSDPSTNINKIWFSPYNLRREIQSCIHDEIKNAKKDKKSFITLKMNSLCDKEMIDLLYEAADAGVKITIFCRGICSIKPKKNITIRSIVGRFLEHSRIYHFYNNNKPKIYISSADLLTRNLDKRFELMLKITDDICKEKITNILQMYYEDISNTFVMNDDGSYRKLIDKKGVNIHEEFIKEAEGRSKFKSMPKLYNKTKM
jgi:polyphosphate kinase